MDSVTFRIGGREWSAPPMAFFHLSKAWPHIKDLNGSLDLVERTEIGLEIVAIALSCMNPAPSAFELKMALRPDEILGIDVPLAALIEASLPPVPKALETGEAMAASSTATSDASSQNLPPVASAEATPASLNAA